ncbi:methyl-accepting chemotaxis protein [Pseudoxanthomonas mexicana]|uniref:methyl-accepting chemotaxis protein n=1 Tax=Pseudoxanthomonas mexicana TaxID=128785 RepID=UPI00398AD2EF
MRKNLPITGHEVFLSDTTTIVSKTDGKGVIREINRDFLDISGFSTDELLGSAHNIVRHPDMPPAAFADLWRDLKAGLPWVGMVKNRCKNGDHYWVHAHATPCHTDGKLVGYMSVRRQASREAIAAAEQAYAAINQGDPGLAVEHGQVVRTSPFARLQRLLAGARRHEASYAAGMVAIVLAAALAGYGLAKGSIGSTIWPALLLTGAFAFFAVRELRRRDGELASLAATLQAMTSGDYTREIDIAGEGMQGHLARVIKSMQIRQGYEVQQLKMQAEENLRIRNALDAVKANVMIADRERRIVYLNPAMRALLEQAQDDIRKTLPDFDAGKVEGGCVDQFHVQPERQIAVLDTLTGTHQARLRFGSQAFSLLINPVFDAAGQRVATVVEWHDVTTETVVEAEITTLLEAARKGNFGLRVPVTGMQGMLRQLALGVNGLVDTVSSSAEQVSRLLNALAHGDLTTRMEGDFHGVFARMRDDANATVAQLTDIVGRIQHASGQINTAAGEIASGNNDLSRRTEQQAANLEETAASMEELTSTVHQNADSARQANQLAIGAAGVASQGGQVVGQVVATMRDIEQSSHRIAEIISVIDGIAFQTNVLALNAAVEAARAGDQGRGFAVVASEVRTLAQRSASAAKEIKQLIDDSVGKVAEGSVLVNQAGTTMGEIVASVQRVTDIMAEISAASQEQSVGIEQVNQTITQMDETTQQNAALVEEASAAAHSLEDQAHALQEVVSVFRIDPAPSAAVPQPGRQAAAESA